MASHNILTHASLPVFRKVLTNIKISLNENEGIEITRSLGKQYRLHFSLSKNVTNQPLIVICSNFQVSPVTLCNCFKYYMYFIHERLRFTQIYFLKIKDEVYKTFVHFEATNELQLNNKIKVFWSYLGDKFHALSLLFSQCGIIHLTYCPYIYEQNGLNERKYKQFFLSRLSYFGSSIFVLNILGYVSLC